MTADHRAALKQDKTFLMSRQCKKPLVIENIRKFLSLKWKKWLDAVGHIRHRLEVPLLIYYSAFKKKIEENNYFTFLHVIINS